MYWMHEALFLSWCYSHGDIMHYYVYAPPGGV